MLLKLLDLIALVHQFLHCYEGITADHTPTSPVQHLVSF